MDNDDSEDSLEIGGKSWNRVIKAASTNGYREGIEEGSRAVFQDDFDRGYENGFKAAFELGKYKGLAGAFAKDYKHPKNIEEILEKTRRGACHICVLESTGKEGIIDNPNISSDEIIADHRKHVETSLKTLHDYFEKFIKKHEDTKKNESND